MGNSLNQFSIDLNPVTKSPKEKAICKLLVSKE